MSKKFSLRPKKSQLNYERERTVQGEFRITTSGSRALRRRNRLREELVGVEKCVTIKAPIAEFRRTKYYKIVKNKH